jgi:hypothetical protein
LSEGIIATDGAETMSGRAILYILTCSPSVLIFAAWVKVYWAREWKWRNAFGLIALSIVTVNAIYGAGTLLYYESRPPSHLPPWNDPETLGLGLLFLLAPFGMILGGVAACTGAPKWLAWVVEIASLPLLAVGLMVGSTV